MSKETENLKLFKYDSETDDFNTTTFNVQQCLNDNWDKIDLHLNNTQQQITDVNLKDESQDKLIKEIQDRIQLANIKRLSKDDSGVFENIWWQTSDGKYIATSSLKNKDTNGKYTTQVIALYSPPGNYQPTDPRIIYYNWTLMYDEDGELIERRLVK